MLPKISLLDELRKGGYEASLITTFNAYLPFYEEVVLRRLVNAGVRHNVLMMDASQYAHSVASHPPKLAGRHYTLMPVKVASAFHPKLVFLAGKQKGLVLVGSHNVTLAGFGFNRELTNLVRIQGAEDTEGVTLARDVWAEIEHWLANFADGVPDHVRSMVRRVKDFAPWLKGEAESHGDIRLLSGRPGALPLWEQLTDLVDGETAQVSLDGAFFDQELRFLERVKQDLEPDRFTVAIDPDTVQIPPRARTVSGVSLVRADRLGVEDINEAETNRYLHAKGIFVEQENGGAVFASGSANPSAPAWLSSETAGNVELMLAYRGDRARATAEDIGFALIANMPALSDTDWQTIALNEDQHADPEPPAYRNGIAVVEEVRVVVDKALLHGFGAPTFVLCTADGAEIARSNALRVEGEVGIIEFSVAELAKAIALHVFVAGELVLKLLLHHAHMIEEQARSGTQRRFKEALLSLETDTPNIELLIHCIDKIVFSEVREAPSHGPKKVGTRDEPSPADEVAPTSLAIDVSDVKQRKSKKRLSHSNDFAYLLDALIYHLRIQEDKSIEEVDRFGRSEEEQVGADDDPDAGGDNTIGQKQEALLDVCHTRVATVINRMVAQLSAYAKGDQPLGDVLVRLLAVLAVLRELRGCDGRVAWVEKGKTTVPVKYRLRLLEEIMLNLFEGKSSLLHLDALGEDFQQSDDVARLKGLVLWLAWDCGLTMDLFKPFMESREDLDQRLRRNAMVLALVQMIQADDVIIDEARQSIGSLTSTEMGWLKDVQRLAHQCESIRQDVSTLRRAEGAEAGDIAVHRKLNGWDLRMVASRGGNRISLIRLAKDNDRLTYTTEHLAVARLT